MGIKQTDILSFIEPESTGFIYETARSFLKRHSNPESLLGQLMSLLAQGQLGSCHDLIQLIIREGHELADNSQVYLLRAQIAFEQSENLGEVMAWIQQAKLCQHLHAEDITHWDELMHGVQALKEGDYQAGENVLEALTEINSVSVIARYRLAHHYFWKNINTEKALFLLEELCEERPEFLKAKSCLGFVYNKLGMKEKAQNAFAYCLERETNPERIKFYRQQLAS